MKAQYQQIQTVLGNTDKTLLSRLADFGYMGWGLSESVKKKKHL